MSESEQQGRVRYDAADRQALTIVTAIRSLTTELETRRVQLAKAGRTVAGAALRRRLTNDIDRLTNLVDLAGSIPRTTLHPHTRLTLDTTLEALRRNLSRCGRALAMDRVRSLRSLSETLASRREVPVGKSHLLRPQFMRCVTYLTILVDGLTAEDLEDLKTTATAINDLIAAERFRGLIASFGDDHDLPLIDVAGLSFPIVAPDDGGPADTFEAIMRGAALGAA
ncbi:hypothetical protein ACM64Y_13995 [Novispirillum sp. DQ9]|uniref:hypothetical protein n=1 Tax=Novispirillum sp. DQ9 TaxID=3398612 RepID=UPI003C79A129